MGKLEKKHVKIRKSVLIMLCCLCVLLAAGTATGVFYAFRTQKTYGELAQLASAVNANYYTDVDEDGEIRYTQLRLLQEGTMDEQNLPYALDEFLQSLTAALEETL